MKYVIIGNGAAGVHAAEAIRSVDPKGDIAMIGDETNPPYCRPMISMVLEGSLQTTQLPIRSSNFYNDLKIEPILGKRVTRIDTDNQRVEINSSHSIPYDRLLIAAGADPRPVKAQGTDLKGIFYMRSESHIRDIIAALPGASHALVLGGGLVGFKAAYGLMRRGLKTTLLIRSGYPLSMQVDQTAGKIILDELLRHGLLVKTGLDVVAFEGIGTVKAAVLSDGSTLPCDLVVIGKGVLPATSFVPRRTISVDLGILVNDYMETTSPGIYAAGDVAESTDIARKSRWVNAIWTEAVIQGRIAGLNMAGLSVPYKGSLSRNTIRIFNTDVMSAGLINPDPNDSCQQISNYNSRIGTYRKLVFREDHLVGMVLINRIEQGGLLMSMIQNEIPIRIQKEQLLDFSWNYGKYYR